MPLVPRTARCGCFVFDVTLFRFRFVLRWLSFIGCEPVLSLFFFFCSAFVLCAVNLIPSGGARQKASYLFTASVDQGKISGVPLVFFSPDVILQTSFLFRASPPPCRFECFLGVCADVAAFPISPGSPVCSPLFVYGPAVDRVLVEKASATMFGGRFHETLHVPRYTPTYFYKFIHFQSTDFHYLHIGKLPHISETSRNLRRLISTSTTFRSYVFNPWAPTVFR